MNEYGKSFSKRSLFSNMHRRLTERLKAVGLFDELLPRQNRFYESDNDVIREFNRKFGQNKMLRIILRDKDVSLYINSPGGYIHSGLAIMDTMNHIKPDVSTTCVGIAASMASVLLSAGKKGKRFILPHAEVMIHQPLGGVEGQASDIEISAKHILKQKELMNKILAKNTGHPLKDIERDVDRDYYLDADQAKKYGLVDEILKAKS